MKEISWTQLKLLTLTEIKNGECLKITGDGEMAFYAIIQPEQVMKDRVEAICGQIDASRGR